MRLLPICAALGAALSAVVPASAQRIPAKPTTKAPPAKDSAAKRVAPPPAPEAPKFAYLQGVAVDSVHEEPLAGALIQVEGTTRIAPTDSLGRFLVDSIPPGTYRVLVDHPMLDTLGISLVTPPMTFVLNEITRTTIAVPGAERLTSLFCPAARRALGPGALVGRVREPDTEEPAVGARVSLVYFDPDIPGLPTQLRVKKSPRVREATVAEDGTYRLCGLPSTFEGKLQAQRKDGGATAEVTVSQSEGVLALRSMSVAAMPKIAAAGDTGTQAPVQRGAARVFGRVLNANGAPVVDARVSLMGYSNATKTRANGEFVLDSLPSGTQALVVRQIGYKPIEQTVELSARSPARVTVKLGVLVPELSAVEVVAVRDEGLQRVGFLDRKRTSAQGHFIDPETIERRKATMFSDLLRTVPGIRVQQFNGGAQVFSTRNSSQNGCVTMWVDGAQWQQLSAGDLDSFVQPQEVAAIEVYQGTQVPPQFSQPGQSCAAVVVWTKLRVESKRKR
jgi:hypothetical protein